MTPLDVYSFTSTHARNMATGELIPREVVDLTPTWPGDPGDGNYNLGWAYGPNGRGDIADAQLWTPDPPSISVYHNYSNATMISETMLNQAIAAGLIPSQSFKMTSFSFSDIVTGLADSVIDSNAAMVLSKAPHPVWLCYFHEPEDNITTTLDQTNYRAAYRRIVLRFRAAGITNVTWMPIYMNPYTFGTSAGRDWRWWHADWNGSGWDDDITMTVFGADTYNPMPGGTNSWGFAEMWDLLRSKVELPGYPVWDYVQPEFGMSKHATPYPNWLTWCNDAKAYAKANRIKNFTYWNNSDDEGRYAFEPEFDPGQTKIAGWESLAAGAVNWGGV